MEVNRHIVPSSTVTGTTLVVVCSVPMCLPPCHADMEGFNVEWITLGRLWHTMQIEGGLQDLLTLCNISHVLFYDLPLTEEKFLGYKECFRKVGFRRVYCVTEGVLRKWVSDSLLSVTPRKGVLMPGTSPPGIQIRGRQQDVVFLMAGFPKADIRLEIQNSSQVVFVPPDEIFALTRLDQPVQVGLINPDLDNAELEHLENLLDRKKLPPHNIVEEDFSGYEEWLCQMLGVSYAAPRNGHSALQSAPVDPLYQARKEPPSPDVCRSETPVPLPPPAPKVRVGNVDLHPQIVVLGVNLSAVPDLEDDLRFQCHNPSQTSKLDKLDVHTQVVVLIDNNLNEATITRMESCASDISAKLIRMSGGTGEFKAWLSETDVDQLLALDSEETLPGVLEEDSLDEVEPEPEPGVRANLPVPVVFSERLQGPSQATFEVRPADKQVTTRSTHVARRQSNSELQGLMERFWHEADGKPKRLSELITAAGYATTAANVSTKKWQLEQKGWKPPKVPPNSPAGLTKAAAKPPIPTKVTASAGKLSQEPVPEIPDGPMEMLRKGQVLVAQGMDLIEEAGAQLKVQFGLMNSVVSAIESARQAGLNAK